MLCLPLSRNCEKRLHLQPKNSGFIPSSRSPVGRGNREAHPKRSFLSLWPPDEEVTTVPAPGAWWSTMNLFSKKIGKSVRFRPPESRRLSNIKGNLKSL